MMMRESCTEPLRSCAAFFFCPCVGVFHVFSEHRTPAGQPILYSYSRAQGKAWDWVRLGLCAPIIAGITTFRKRGTGYN